MLGHNIKDSFFRFLSLFNPFHELSHFTLTIAITNIDSNATHIAKPKLGFMVKQDANHTIFSTRSSKGIGLYTISWTSQTSPWTHWKSTEEINRKLVFQTRHTLKQNWIWWSHVAVDCQCHIRFQDIGQNSPTPGPWTGTGSRKQQANARSFIWACTRLGCACETMSFSPLPPPPTRITARPRKGWGLLI